MRISEVQLHSLFFAPHSSLIMRCPVCKREFEKADSPALPFCSERCRTIDLGRWLGETYSLPVVPDPEADETLDSDEAQGNGASGQPS
jgi:endogenous inhibitor of DNA gyrase (YacG/DUF329 family)